MEVAEHLHSERFLVESGLDRDLAAKPPGLVLALRMHGACNLIDPLDHRSTVTKPVAAVLGVVVGKIRDGGHKLDAVHRLRT
jgi:hypothetical protein